MDNKLNKMRVKILPAALIAALIVVFTAAAPAAYAASNFYITNMNVDVIVNEDDTYNVTESLNVTFTSALIGMVRLRNSEQASMALRCCLHRSIRI